MKAALAPCRTLGLALFAGVAAFAAAEPAEPPEAEAALKDARVELELAASEATVGDQVGLRIGLTLPEGSRLEPPAIGPELGPFTVVAGSWSGPEPAEAGRSAWTWEGSISAFRTGELRLPPLRVTVEGPDGATTTLRTPERTLVVRSVLEASPPDEEPELADLKPPVSLAPDYGSLLAALLALGLLALAAFVLWWLHRRYAARLAAVPAPEDPFHRTPPHVWIYEALGRLLERRLPESGETPLFFEELAQIVKTYLSGRYRVELAERTTAEVPGALDQAGSPADAIAEVERLLGRADRVKFARERPGPGDCREAVERAYRIVDATKPTDAVRRDEEPLARRGAA